MSHHPVELKPGLVLRRIRGGGLYEVTIIDNGPQTGIRRIGCDGSRGPRTWWIQTHRLHLEFHTLGKQ